MQASPLNSGQESVPVTWCVERQRQPLAPPTRLVQGGSNVHLREPAGVAFTCHHGLSTRRRRAALLVAGLASSLARAPGLSLSYGSGPVLLLRVRSVS